MSSVTNKTTEKEQLTPASHNDHDTLYRKIRILRKKLKQVENLKLLPRKLNEEETRKIERQNEFRVELLDLLAQQNDLITETAPVLEKTKHVEPPSPQKLPSKDKQIEPKKNLQNVSNSKGDSENRSDVKVSPAPSASKQVEAKVTKPDPLQDIKREWATKYFELLELPGHTDLVLCVDINATYIVSGSRDTSVKLWNVLSGELIHNFGGHTGFVSCVKLLELSNENSGDVKSVIASGSHDCSIKFWDVHTGGLIKEFYVYNSVLCMTTMDEGKYLVAGLDGGKMELYNINTGITPALSYSIETEAISCLSCDGNSLAVGGSDGLVTILKFEEEAFQCLYSLDEHLASPVKSISLVGNDVILGDDGANIKVLRWKSGNVSCLANHHSEFGVTDALCKHGNYLLSSAYDYDNGTGYLNVRDRNGPQYSYISSILDPDITHILSLAAVTLSSSQGHKQLMSLVTGGMILVLWREDPSRNTESVKCINKRLLLADDEMDSDNEDSEDNSDLSFDDSLESDVAENASGWWCNLL